MHVGSIGMDLSQIVQGARQIIDLAEKINKQAGYKQITGTRLHKIYTE